MHEEEGSLPADYSEIFSRYGPVIFSYLLLHASSREEAEDLTIEVFASALEAAGEAASRLFGSELYRRDRRRDGAGACRGYPVK